MFLRKEKKRAKTCCVVDNWSRNTAEFIITSFFDLIVLMFVQRAMSDSEMPDDSGSESSRGHLSPGESKP